MPTQVIAGRYRLEREIGRGGMGSVWLCRDERLGRDVAVKQLGGMPGESTTQVARALREARHSAALNHPNVVSVFDAVEEDDQVWLVMEYVRGRTLADLIRSGERLPTDQLARIGAQVADGLAAAHARGTVHRDVKPGNILLRDDGVAKIADFGIARTLGQEHLTRTGLVTGTPAYFSPELARGEDPSPASDVWALGASLYAAAEGEAPYAEQANAIAMLTTIASQAPRPPRRAGDLARPIARMMESRPEDRWTMRQAADELRRVHEGDAGVAGVARDAGEATVAMPVAPPRSVGPVIPDEGSGRRRPGGLAVGALVALLALAALVVAGGWLMTRDDTPTAAEGPAATAPSSSAPTSAAPSSSAPTTEEPSSSAPTSEAPSRAPSEAPSGTRADFIEGYYSLLPDRIDAAWAQLSAGEQARIGYDTYRGFWSTIDAVRVDGTRPSDGGSVLVDLTYATAGGSQSETRQIEVGRSGESYRITGDQVR
ncbi:protein kinase [Nocardioidaceae bacterium]|nr:protein kinase [Nocardioidaceae bacterium]